MLLLLRLQLPSQLFNFALEHLGKFRFLGDVFGQQLAIGVSLLHLVVELLLEAGDDVLVVAFVLTNKLHLECHRRRLGTAHRALVLQRHDSLCELFVEL